jgi:hypothetical protein
MMMQQGGNRPNLIAANNQVSCLSLLKNTSVEFGQYLDPGTVTIFVLAAWVLHLSLKRELVRLSSAID